MVPPTLPPVRPSAGTRFSALPVAVQSAAIATVAMALFSAVPPSVRLLSDTMSAYQIVGIRAALGVAMACCYFAWAGFYRLKSPRPVFHFTRATFNFVGMVMWFWALKHVELAKGIAIHFTMPLFIALLAWFFLKERIDSRRGLAMLVGFAGVLIILRPGMIGIGLPEMAILGSAVLYAGAVIFLKIIVRDEGAFAVTFYTNLFMGLWCIAPAAYYWAPITLDDVLPILGLGVCGLMAPFLVATTLKSADASLIGAFDFLRLPFTAVFGFALFGEIPDVFVWVGAAIIFVSTWHVTAREAGRAKARKSGAP
jgi:drug/metabolite transporter (DMT)-like permease